MKSDVEEFLSRVIYSLMQSGRRRRVIVVGSLKGYEVWKGIYTVHAIPGWGGHQSSRELNPTSLPSPHTLI